MPNWHRLIQTHNIYIVFLNIEIIILSNHMLSLQVKAFSMSLESFRTAIVVGGTNISEQVNFFALIDLFIK